MSSEWHTTTFAEAPFAVIDGDRGTNYPKQHEFSSSGHCLFLNAGNVTLGGFVFSDCAFITEEKDSILRKGKLVRHDLVLTTRGTVGNVAYFSDEVPFSHIRINSGMVIFRPDQARIDPYYLYLFLRSKSFNEQVAFLTSGSAQPQLPIRDMNRVEMPLPPLDDQRKICSILRALDDRITLLRETNTTLEAIAQALFKSWFVDFDPVRVKAEGLEPQAMDAPTAALFPDSFEESELGLVPKGWRMSTLGAICDSNGGAIQTGPFGSQLHAADYVAEGVPVVMPKDISNRRVDATTAARVRLEDVQRLARHKLRDGDIVFSRRGDVEKHALIGETERGWLCGTGCLLVRPGTRRNVAGYLSRSLDLPQIKQWLTQHAVGATMPNLNTGILAAVPVVLPADEVLAAFEQATNALDKRISAGNAAAQTLTQLRDTLLPRLISGQLRLPEAEVHLQDVLA